MNEHQLERFLDDCIDYLVQGNHKKKLKFLVQIAHHGFGTGDYLIRYGLAVPGGHKITFEGGQYSETDF